MPNLITLTVNAQTADAAAAVENLFAGLTEGLERLTGFGDFLAGLGQSIAAAFSIEKITEFTEQAINTEAALEKLSAKTGLSVEELSGLQNATGDAGLGFEEFSLLISQFSDRVFAAVKQGGQLAEVFRDMGVHITGDSGQLLPMNQILASTADWFQKTAAGAEKANTARELFGRGGRELIPILNEGAAGLKRIQDAAAANGTLISSDNARSAEDFERSLNSLESSLKAVFIVFANDILPSLQQFVDWLQTAQRETGAVSGAAQTLADIFHGLAAAVFAISAVFESLGEAIGNSLAAQAQIGSDAIITYIKVLQALARVIEDVGLAVGDFVRRLVQLAKVQLDIDTLHFKDAVKDAAGALGGLSSDAKKIGGDIEQNLAKAFGAVAGLGSRSWATLKSVGQLTLGDLQKQWASFWNSALNLFNTRKPAKSAATPELVNDKPPPQSEEAKRLIEEIDKAYAAAVQGRLALLETEHQAWLKKAREEITNAQERADKILEIDQTFAAKARAIREQQAREKGAEQLGGLKFSEQQVNQNPDLTIEMRNAQLMNLYLQQRAVLTQQINNAEQSKAAATNEDQRLAAAKEINALTQQQIELQKKISEVAIQKDSFAQIKRSLTELMNSWGTLVQQIGQTFSKTISTAIDSVSSNLTKVILQTESWRQALTNIGMSILETIIQSIIKMAVTWIAQQVLMATVGKALQAASVATLIPIASAASLIWAAPAALATIATDGEAADAAPGLVGAAIIGTEAISGLAQGGAVDGGGTETSDSILARLSRGEYVLPALAARELGPNILQGLRDRSISQRQIMAGVRGGGGSGPVHVQGHKVNVGFLHSARDAKDYLASSEGETHIVNIVKRKRGDIGIGT
ncbi:MAG TPA: hypothetical protein VHB20_14695 [Verrucomicrobiae bacterium]|jgi:hypothetical protein|nr:hypothetical protein [Verrucomicrobiae bacterium]